MPRAAAFRNFIWLIVPAILLWCGPCHAIDIAVSGTWTLVAGSGDLVAGPGSDLQSAYESGIAQGALTISNTTGDSDIWRVDVRRSDVTWPASLRLYVKRTSDGVGGGFTLGGTAYQEVTASDTSFFVGSGNRAGIEVQLRVDGASVDVPPDTYSTSVVYTVVDTS